MRNMSKQRDLEFVGIDQENLITNSLVRTKIDSNNTQTRVAGSTARNEGWTSHDITGQP